MISLAFLLNEWITNLQNVMYLREKKHLRIELNIDLLFNSRVNIFSSPLRSSTILKESANPIRH